MSAQDFGDSFHLTLITDNFELARAADQADVDLIGVDLETLGKAERQVGFDVRISDHSCETLKNVMQEIAATKSFVRLNRLNAKTLDEINAVLELGAQNLMLPFFHEAREVDAFVRLVAGRARVILLLETAAATIRIHDILAVSGIDEVMVGLNDLRIAAKVSSHFEVLVSPVMDMIAAQVHKAGLPLSVGGIAPSQSMDLPIPADLVLAQYPRLNATGAWISRSMIKSLKNGNEIGVAVRDLRNRLTYWSHKSPTELEAARQELRQRLKELVLASA